MNEERDLRKNKKGILVTLAITLLIVLCIFLIFDSVTVVGVSMQPNFNRTNGNDKVIISRIYGLDYGDVVVFYNSRLNENLIKRVVGLEGDTISIIEGKLYRNGKLVSENYIKEPMNSAFDGYTCTLKKDQVFVMGDNRNHSEDSRVLGPISKKDILGEVIVKVDYNNGKIYFI